MIWFIADGELRCVDGARRCAVRGLVALASLEAAAEELRDRGEAEEGECVCDDAEGLHRLTLFGRPDQRRIEIEVRGEGSGRELELWLMRHALDELPVRPWREPPAPSPEEPPAPSPEEPPAH